MGHLIGAPLVCRGLQGKGAASAWPPSCDRGAKGAPGREALAGIRHAAGAPQGPMGRGQGAGGLKVERFWAQNAVAAVQREGVRELGAEKPQSS